MCSIFIAYVYFCLLLVNNTHIFYVYYLMWLHIQTLSQAIVKVVIPTERYMFFFIITDLNIENFPFGILKKNGDVEEKVMAWLSNGCFMTLVRNVFYHLIMLTNFFFLVKRGLSKYLLAFNLSTRNSCRVILWVNTRVK